MIEIDGTPIRVIDCHTHIFPDEMSLQRETWLTRDRWFGELYTNPKARLATAEELIASMDAAGVDFSIVCGFPWHDNAHARFHNAYMADAARRFPERIGWLGIVSPTAADAVAVLENCLAEGTLGFGELNADAQEFRWDQPDRYRATLEAISRAGRPILVHASEPLGHSYPGKGRATPDQLLALAGAFPNLTIVAAHWGGGLPFYELMPEVGATLTRVAYDSGATTYLYRHDIFTTVCGIVGAEKVLFASDYPVLGQSGLMRKMLATTWSEPQAAALVMGGNAARIFGLEHGT